MKGTDTNKNDKEEVVLSDLSAIQIADIWHTGQWSALYALFSSGEIKEGAELEVTECLKGMIKQDSIHEAMKLFKLLKYIRYRREDENIDEQDHWETLHAWKQEMKRHEQKQA